jgi:arsenite/tail-anchored protein-transporting ATPase
VAALALEAARRGQRPLVVELGHRASMHGVLGARDIGFEPAPVTHGVWAANIDFDAALADYLGANLPFGSLARAILDNGVMHRFFHAAPAVAEVITLDRVRRLVDDGSFDPVLVDLDATGHALMLLELPRVLDGLVGSGRLRTLVSRVDALLNDGELACLHLVTLPDELPVMETIELYQTLATEHRVPLGALLVNRMPPAPLGSEAAAQLDQLQAAAGSELADDLGLARRALARISRAEAQLRLLSAEVPLARVEIRDRPEPLSLHALAGIGAGLLERSP